MPTTVNITMARIDRPDNSAQIIGGMRTILSIDIRLGISFLVKVTTGNTGSQVSYKLCPSLIPGL